MSISLSKIPTGVIAPVKPKAAEIIAATGDAVTHVWGASTTPDHNNLRCVDFMVGSIAHGDRVAQYVIDHHQRLGVNGIIWNRRVMGFPHPGNSSYRGPAGVWRPYSGPSPHTDHPHVEFDASAYRAGDAAKPTPKPQPAPDVRPTPPKEIDVQPNDVIVKDKNGKGVMLAQAAARAVHVNEQLPVIVGQIGRLADAVEQLTREVRATTNSKGGPVSEAVADARGVSAYEQVTELRKQISKLKADLAKAGN